jgi:cation diffusion facilitator family transporter
MMDSIEIPFDPPLGHRHVFLGAGHARNESRTWMVVGLCTAMMLLEIIGGYAFGSIALVADGIHMSTHAGAMLLAALAYRYARRHAEDERFAFGTGKLGDLAAFASAIVLAMLSILVAYEALSRLFAPIRIDYAAALPIAALGLVVNAASAWILSGGHDHGHQHGHDHGHHHHDHHHEDEARLIETPAGLLRLEVFEDGTPPGGAPPRFRLHGVPVGQGASIETLRPDGTRQGFALRPRDGFLESLDEIPEPHKFQAALRVAGQEYRLAFEEYAHDAATMRDNNMRAAYIHVLADAAVSILVVLGLLAAKVLGWVFMDPVMGIIGALVIANWAYGLIRAAAAVLLDMTPSETVASQIRGALEQSGDHVTDLHVWRVGPGHLSAIVSLATSQPKAVTSYKTRLAHIASLSHLTIEVDAR